GCSERPGAQTAANRSPTQAIRSTGSAWTGSRARPRAPACRSSVAAGMSSRPPERRSSPMADRAGRLTAGERTRATTRELAQRLSGADEVLLLWHPEGDRVELAVRNLA